MNEHQDTCIYTATSSVWQKVFDVKYMSFYILNKRLSYMGGCLLFFFFSFKHLFGKFKKLQYLQYQEYFF